MKRVLLAVVLAVAVVAGLVVWVLATPGEDKSQAQSAPPSAEPTTTPSPYAPGGGVRAVPREPSVRSPPGRSRSPASLGPRR